MWLRRSFASVLRRGTVVTIAATSAIQKQTPKMYKSNLRISLFAQRDGADAPNIMARRLRHGAGRATSGGGKPSGAGCRRNQSGELSLMSQLQVNSGTANLMHDSSWYVRDLMTDKSAASEGLF